jgi:hypothetical protein
MAGVFSASNRNEYQKQKNHGSGEQSLGLTTLQPSVSLLSRQCGILNISQTSRPLQSVTESFTFLFIFLNEYQYRSKKSMYN